LKRRSENSKSKRLEDAFDEEQKRRNCGNEKERPVM
jgi:hypothetical protein